MTKIKNKIFSSIESKTHLVLGGARSGKSHFGEQLLLDSVASHPHIHDIHYIATAQALDEEMRQRIEQHKTQRKQSKEIANWLLIEEPLKLGETIKKHKSNSFILIDCLTLWLSNCLQNKVWPEQKTDFIESVKNSQSTIIMVSNEVGQGVIPMGKLSRHFVDESGRLHQELAKVCDHVTFITAGIPQQLK